MPVIKMNLYAQNLQQKAAQPTQLRKVGASIVKNATGLRAPMVNRVANAKSGCSACGH